MSTIKPLADRIVIKPMTAAEKTASGIYIPEIAREKPVQGIVIAVGIGAPHVTMEVSVGDKVVYSKGAGLEIKDDDLDVIMIKHSDILAII